MGQLCPIVISNQGERMKTVGDQLEPFVVTGVNPGSDQFFDITEKSFEGKWKVIVYYPKDFTFVCPTEIVAYDKLFQDFADRDAVLLTGSTDNEFCKLAWKKPIPILERSDTFSLPIPFVRGTLPVNLPIL